MTTHVRLLITAAVVGLGTIVPARAQTIAATDASVWLKPAAQRHAAPSRASGSITSEVRDSAGVPVAGAIVSAIGGRTAAGTTDDSGRCTLQSLPAGDYLVRVHRAGFTVGNSAVIRVRPGHEASRSFVLHPAPQNRAIGKARVEVLAAGFVGTTGLAAEELPDDPTSESEDHDHSETAWRLRHLPRSVLKDAAVAATALEDDEPSGREVKVASYSRASAALYNHFPLNTEVNILTTSAFDTPDQLVSDSTLARGVAYVSVGAAAGRHGDWSVQGALNQGDVASWAIAGSFLARSPARHRYEAGMSYAVQRYTGHNPDALAAVAEGTRNAGTVFAYDTWTLNDAISIVYGARYARYGYIDEALFSPRARLEIRPVERLRLSASAGLREDAPGGEEFLPSGLPGPWLPPERTFAALGGGGVLPERTEHYELALEHDFGRSARSAVVGVRAFYQRTEDQMATIFGLGGLERSPAELGHYYVASAGDVLVRGWGVSFSRNVVDRVRGSVDYRLTTAEWTPSLDAALVALALPELLRGDAERVHDLTTSIETQIPVTATRVFALYRINTAYPRGSADDETSNGTAARFDVQVTQSLPFLDFTNAQWEALVGVRNLFREMTADGSVYDEILVIRPPKRVVGGLTVRF